MAEIYRHQQAQEIGSVGSVEVAYSLVKSSLTLINFHDALHAASTFLSLYLVETYVVVDWLPCVQYFRCYT